MSFWSRLMDWLGAARGRVPAAQASRPQPEAVASEEFASTATDEPAREPTSGEYDAQGFEPAPDSLADEPPSALPAQAALAQAPREAAQSKRRMIDRHDGGDSMTVILEGPEEEILWTIARRIESRRLELPSLPSTSMAVIDLANNPSVEFQQLVAQISMDPVLSSELLRTANSVLYASEEPVDTLHSAIVRIGLRALRSMIFSVSMRGTILRAGVFSDYAEEVWRQSYSVASTAKQIAPVIGIDPEKAFLLGLLQDIGKISLLAMLSKAVKDPRACTPNLVSHVFQVFHQEAGAAMAHKWKLPQEFESVAGCHHDWALNSEHTRSAALANLAYQLDMAYTLQDPQLVAGVRVLPSLVYLAPHEEARARILQLAQELYALSPEASLASSSEEVASPSSDSGGA